MKINIEKTSKGYRADFIDLPGSPAVGDGKTKEMAIAALFCRNKEVLQQLDFDYLEINGKPYQDPYFKQR